MTRTVTQILARRTADRPATPLFEGYGTLVEINTLLDELAAAAQPADQSDDWSLIYNEIFSSSVESIGKRTYAAFDLTETPFPSYYDPDGDYDEDVQAWVRAFKEGLREVVTKVAEYETASGCR